MINKKKFNNLNQLNYVANFQFNCFMYIFWLIALFIHIFYIPYPYHSSYNKLAFTINIIYFEDCNNKCKNIRSIEFEGLNNLNLLKKCLQCYYNHLFYLSNISYNQITNIVYSLKVSGFIYQIKHYLVKIKKTQYSLLNISTNVLVKRITILNYKKLRISQHLLKHYFSQYLGLPKNYQQLNSSVQKVYSWYNIRGFNHVKINLRENYNHDLYINIQEGVITKTEVICQSVLKVSKHYLSFIENRIMKELSISPGSIINTKKIEIGIKQLKEAGLISYCKYRIINSKKELKVVLSYDISNNHIYYIYAKYMNLYPGNTTNIYYYLQKNKYIHSIFKYLNYLINFLPSNHINDYSILPNIPLLKLNNLYIKRIQTNLALKYSKIHHGNKKYNRINFNIKMLHSYPIFDILISLPDLSMLNKELIYFLLYFQNNINHKNTIFPIKTQYFRNIYSFNHYDYNTYIKSNNIGIRFQRPLFNYTYINKNIDYVYNNFNKPLIHIKQQYVSNVSLAHKTFQKSLKNLQEIIQQKVLKLGITIQYNNFQSNHNIQQGTSLLLGFNSQTYLPFKKLHILSIADYFSQYMNIEYKQIIVPSKLLLSIKNSYKDALIIYAKLYKPINTLNFFNRKINNSIQSNYIANKNFFYKIPYYLPNSLSLYNAEYHIYFKSYYSLYLFYKYENNLNRPIITNIYNKLDLKLTDILKGSESNIGYGIQFNIPVQNIPPLRIEYCISNRMQNFFQIRLYSKYITII